MKKLIQAFSTLSYVTMLISFVFISFLLIANTINIVNEHFANAGEWIRIVEAVVIVIEIVLAGSFVMIHRHSIEAVVSPANVWNLLTVLLVLYFTFSIEKFSMSNGISFLQKHYEKEQRADFTTDKRWIYAKRKANSARKSLNKWESYAGTHSDRLMIKEEMNRYNKAKEEKAYRLKHYLHATTKQADRAINRSLKKIEEINARIEKRRLEMMKKYDAIIQDSIAKMDSIEAEYKKRLDDKFISFEESAEEIANKIVIAIAIMYLFHSLLIITREEDFNLKDFSKKIFQADRAKSDRIDESVEGIKKSIDELSASSGFDETAYFNTAKEQEKKEKTIKGKDEVSADNSVPMDSDDGRVIGYLHGSFQRGDRITKDDIANMLGVSPATAHRRLNKYAKNGIVEKIDGKFVFTG